MEGGCRNSAKPRKLSRPAAWCLTLTDRPCSPLTNPPAPPTWSALGTLSLPPRIVERMHVHSSDVVATQGMRMCIGMKAKFSSVEGTQT